MASWIARLFGSDDPVDPAETLAQRRTRELAAQLDALDIWSLPTVVAARELVADTAAMMPMYAVPESGGARLDPTPAIIRRPDPAEPYRRTIERIVNQMTRNGRAWIQVDAEGSNGYPLAGHVVDDHRVSATVDPTGRITEIRVDGATVDRTRVRRIPMISDTLADPLGVSPLDRIRVALEQLAEVYRFSSNYYTSGAAVPPYAVVHPNRLSADQAGEFADQWIAARAERRPAILSGGITLETYTAQTAADALMLDAIGYLDSTVARVMQIPPSLLNTESLASLTYSNTQAEFARWLAIGLYPMFLARIEAAFSDMLPRGQVAKFDTSNLTVMEPAAAAATPTREVTA